MRVGIEASKMLISEKTGIENYTTFLVLNLVKLLSNERDLELILYFNANSPSLDRRLLDDYIPGLNNAGIRVWRFDRFYRLGLPMLAARDRVDILHLPSPFVLPFANCPILLTVHDLCWVKVPEEMLSSELALTQPVMDRAIRKASAIIAVSKSTRGDLIQGYGFPEKRVWVTYQGIDFPNLTTIQKGDSLLSRQQERIRRKYGLERYILFVGTLQKRKNLVRLIQSFALLKQSFNIPQQLVLVGGKGWGYEEINDAIERVGLINGIRLLGYVPKSDLPALYSGADVFVYPSLYEGFGLPILEAMANGAVVATSNCSSLPEIGGDAALYFNPYDINQMAETIYRAISDLSLRRELRAKGKDRLKEFNWDQIARRTLDVYRQVIDIR